MTEDHDEDREVTDVERDDAADEDSEQTGVTHEDESGPESGSETADEPLGDLARRLRERQEERRTSDHTVDRGGPNRGETADESGDATGGDTHAETVTDDGTLGGDEPVSELFEEQEVGEVDTEQVWESVLGDEESETPSIVSELDDRVETTDDDAEHLVPKRAYCESCHYFSEPPVVACTYEGSSIVEVLDSEQFRVRNCPVVAGEIDTKGRRLADRDPMSSVGDAE